MTDCTVDFWRYLQAAKLVDLEGLSADQAHKAGTLFARGHSVADLCSHYTADFGHLPHTRLGELRHAFAAWKAWCQRTNRLLTARKTANKPALPPDVLLAAPSSDQLGALERTLRLVEDHSTGLALPMLETGVALWKSCVALSLQSATVTCQLVEGLTPAQVREAAADHDAYLGQSLPLSEIAPHRWLAIRRGEYRGALRIELDLPRDKMCEQVAIRQELLGPNVKDRSTESLLDELVYDDLRPSVLRFLDGDAQRRAISAACQALTGLLQQAPIAETRIGAAYLGRPGAPAAAVTVESDGDLMQDRVLKLDGRWSEQMLELWRRTNVKTVVVPTHAAASEQLAALTDALSKADIHVVRVRPAAIAEARRPLTDPPMRLKSSIASALILARRALDPVKEWGLVDPVSIGVAEYQNDLDEGVLRAALKETIELHRLKRRRKGVSPTARSGLGQAGSSGKPGATRPTAPAQLNPLVKSLRDLRAGMTVNGVVTNVSNFGAFVNIGLPTEGLIHISELSNDFVASPSDVVSIGQQVTAHVLAVEPQRARISLSLKEQGLAMDGPRRGGARRERPSSGGAPKSRTEALANLERLFKK